MSEFTTKGDIFNEQLSNLEKAAKEIAGNARGARLMAATPEGHAQVQEMRTTLIQWRTGLRRTLAALDAADKVLAKALKRGIRA